MGRRLRPDQLRAALADLAEFGWVSLTSNEAAQQVYRAAREAGQRAVIVKAGRGWWRVEITDMSPRRRETGGRGEA